MSQSKKNLYGLNHRPPRDLVPVDTVVYFFWSVEMAHNISVLNISYLLLNVALSENLSQTKLSYAKILIQVSIIVV